MCSQRVFVERAVESYCTPHTLIVDASKPTVLKASLLFRKSADGAEDP